MGRRKTYSAEQIIMKLREADVLIAQGMTVHELCRLLKIILPLDGRIGKMAVEVDNSMHLFAPKQELPHRCYTHLPN